ALGDRQRRTEIADPKEEEIEAREQAKLMLPVPQRLGQAEAPLDRGPDLLAVAVGEHGRNSQRLAQRQFAFRAAVGILQCRDPALGPALASAELLEAKEERH